MNYKQTINSFSAWTVDRLTGARRATLTMLATFLIAMTAQTAWAWSGSGTSSAPYQISSKEDLNQLATNVNSGTTYVNTYFIVTADIAFTSSDNFTPIGKSEKEFQGSFDGDNHTISGIRLSGSTVEALYYGLFGAIGTGGVVKNVILADTQITGRQHLGGIAGYNQGNISNCHVTATVSIKANATSSYHFGGIVGYNCGTVSGCTSSVTIDNDGQTNVEHLGGIVGINYGNLNKNFVIGATITCEAGTYGERHKHGPVFGSKDGSGTLEDNYYNGCSISDYGVEDNSGAELGYMSTIADGITTSSFTTITVPAHKDLVSGSLSTVPAKTYFMAPKFKTINFSYSGSGNTGDGYCFNVVDADNHSIPVEETSGSSAPYSFQMPGCSVTIPAPVDKWGVTSSANGSETNPYIISDEAGLNLLAQKVNAGNNYEGKYFKLDGDITYSYIQDWNASMEDNFTAIGKSDKPFSGHFDGNGKTISGIRIFRAGVDYKGLFGNSNGELKGITLANASIRGGNNVGGIVGQNGGTVTNCQVANNVKVEVTSNGGSIAGANTGSITNCFVNSSTVSGSSEYIGAIVGTNSGTLTNNHYLSETLGGAGASGSTTGADVAGARKALTIAGGTGVTLSPVGEATTYNNMTTYAGNNAIKYGEAFYSGATETVTLGYGEGVTEGFAISSCSVKDASDGDVSGSANEDGTWSFTMPASNVTVASMTTDFILYQLTYVDVEIETNNNPESYTVETPTFSLNNPSKDGYEFAGWTYGEQTTPTTTVTITKGSTGEKTFTANWKMLLTNEDITVGTIADQTYTGNEIKPAITVKYGTTDITEQCDFTYNNNKVVGTAEVVISAKESSAAYAGEKTVTFKIVPKTVDSPTITLSGTSFEFTGEAIKPTVTVEDGETTIPAEEYTVDYKDNTEVGTATVTITDKEGGNYTVSGSTTFKITPKPNPAVVNVEETPVAIGGEVYYQPTEDVKQIFKGDNASFAISAEASNRMEVTAEGSVKFSKGPSTTIALPKLTVGAKMRVDFYGQVKVKDTEVRRNSIYTRGRGDSSSDGMIDLVSGAEYEVLKDGPLVLTIVLEEEEVVLEGISVTESEPSDGSIVVTAKNKYWTFSSDKDVKVPAGVKVYTCQLNSDQTAVVITNITSTLGGVIKAGNGVLLSSAAGEYTFVPSTETASETKTYENNLLEPVLKATNFASGEYYVLKNNEFHPILANDSNVPANKAVLRVAKKSAARLEIIGDDDVKTAINGIAVEEDGAEWYTISGQRIDKPTKKGLYIKNGKKVIIK